MILNSRKRLIQKNQKNSRPVKSSDIPILIPSFSHDVFQARYLEHQKRKWETIKNNLLGEEKFPFRWSYHQMFLKHICESRRSQRIFIKKKVEKWKLNFINKIALTAPSSCNRQAIEVEKVKPSKELSELMVGGEMWADKADIWLFLYANMTAYKSPAEIGFMPYLDTGFTAQNIYLACETLNLGCCFINPNLTIEESFNRENLKFCGAMAIGYYNRKATKPPKKKSIWIK